MSSASYDSMLASQFRSVEASAFGLLRNAPHPGDFSCTIEIVRLRSGNGRTHDVYCVAETITSPNGDIYGRPQILSETPSPDIALEKFSSFRDQNLLRGECIQNRDGIDSLLSKMDPADRRRLRMSHQSKRSTASAPARYSEVFPADLEHCALSKKTVSGLRTLCQQITSAQALTAGALASGGWRRPGTDRVLSEFESIANGRDPANPSRMISDADMTEVFSPQGPTRMLGHKIDRELWNVVLCTAKMVFDMPGSPEFPDKNASSIAGMVRVASSLLTSKTFPLTENLEIAEPLAPDQKSNLYEASSNMISALQILGETVHNSGFRATAQSALKVLMKLQEQSSRLDTLRDTARVTIAGRDPANVDRIDKTDRVLDVVHPVVVAARPVSVPAHVLSSVPARLRRSGGAER